MGGKRIWRQGGQGECYRVEVRDAEGLSKDSGSGYGEEEKHLTCISEVD